MSEQPLTWNDVMEFIASAVPDGAGVTTGSPIQIETNDSAIIYLLVEKHPWDRAPQWKATAQRIRMHDDR